MWNTLLVGLGWQLGTNWEDVADTVGHASKVVLVLVVLAVVAAVARLLRRGRRAAA